MHTFTWAIKQHRFPLLLLLLVGQLAYAQQETIDLAPMEIVADRAFESKLGISTDVLLGVQETSLSIDQALRRLSSVDTYRSIDSFTAHPTTQGVRFRHTATNATSRALLLVNGVPQNDPFGGWIYWNKLPIESLRSLEVFPVGSVPAWGNYSSGGAIHMLTRSPFEERSRISVMGGSFGTVKAAFDHSSKVSDTTAISVEGRFFTTDGFNVVRSDQRGPVDAASKSDYDYLRAQITQMINDEWQWSLTGQYFDEERINGTPQSPNSTYATDLSWTLEKAPGAGPGFNFVSFYQDRGFQNVFSSVNEDRTSERPVLDQYSVPAEAIGAQATFLWEGNGYLNYLAGADFRHAEGSANELTRNLGAGFTRKRQEGGEQSFAGAFITAQSLPDEDSTLEATLRAGHWSQKDGFRREFNLETDSQTRDTAYPNRSGDVISLNSRYSRRLNANWSFEALVFHGFRAPTLNELYRPFRVRNDITESNPNLGKETSTGGELSLYYLDEASSFEFSAFHYELDDMVTNLFLHNDFGFDPLCGFVPGGGSCNQRGNVESSEVQGFEVAWLWDPGNDLEFLLNYTYSHTEFKRSTIQPSLEGRAFPLSPRHKITSQLVWHSSENLDLLAQFQYRHHHYDNPLNTRKIDSSFVLNLGAHYQVPDAPWSVRIQVDNVLDEDVTTAISSSGIYTQAAPLNAWISLSYDR
ncbi:TonB-dependent receptor [Opitutia bacterium ISCC 51]|nr:TonB-dependent receptor [Opitutae bacterium ISCC 51]QXD30037.1 TonB-dependent receptor [Opitutae bacterium ISCC 52]